MMRWLGSSTLKCKHALAVVDKLVELEAGNKVALAVRPVLAVTSRAGWVLLGGDAARTGQEL